MSAFGVRKFLIPDLNGRVRPGIAEKKANSLISSVRIAVEHVISGVKRLHIVKQVFRNKVEGFDDIVLEIACGLHNFRCDCRRLC